ncbi:hypothetical protein [Nocardia iowensis]|uniref:DUF222 domain-containing protein n=1 Tax=Nocardia iowensis TaxID=204891 RepID=A0ABX8RY37_NOCIO|nr:hypothetical protein [Nocardia iowensis]QXN94589.1 hypothetical protein KV110_16975 [Nocardia iowensis]
MADHEVHAPPSQLAGWKARMLNRIADLAARHTLVLHEGYPLYRHSDGRGAVAIEAWRSRLRDLDTIRGELEIRAELVGVHTELIDAARDAGERGEHWSDRVSSPPTVRDDNPGRAPLLDAIAEDMWTLEHMAAVVVARQYRDNKGAGFTLDPQTRQQYERNMIAVWERINTTAAAAELTEAEQAEIWHRDQDGWLRVFSRTVYGYGDRALEERWHAYAWPGIEWDAHRASTNLPADRVQLIESSVQAPWPGVLIDRAAHAMAVDIANKARFDPSISGKKALNYPTATRANSLDGTDAASWGSEPVGESLTRPPGFDTSAEPE